MMHFQSLIGISCLSQRYSAKNLATYLIEAEERLTLLEQVLVF